MKPVTCLTINLIVDDEYVDMLASLLASNQNLLEDQINYIIHRFAPPKLQEALKESWVWDEEMAVWLEEE